MVQSFGRGLRAEVGIDPAKTDDSLRKLRDFGGDRRVGLGVIRVRRAERKGHGLVYSELIHVSNQIFAQKAGDAVA